MRVNSPSIHRDICREAEEALVRARLSAGHGLWMRARGGSMWPFIQDGDFVHLCPRPRYLPGDVVLIDRGRLGPLHRILWRSPSGWLWVKGDAARQADGLYRAPEALAAVTAVARAGRGVFLHRHIPRLFSVFSGLRGERASPTPPDAPRATMG
ncbi:S24/S26 family peptidase [Myxococcota bacterium]|nr:S24/S26 family peptidase [Myxococcota bacterium]MBU1897003.1 S24/S26 family peptidase [Myxococcota bacterium]